MYVTRFIFDILFQIVSLTELMAGVKASTKTYQLFQITQFPFPVLLKIWEIDASRYWPQQFNIFFV